MAAKKTRADSEGAMTGQRVSASHTEMVEFVRLEYDLGATVVKINAIEHLDNFLGQRLVEGR